MLTIILIKAVIITIVVLVLLALAFRSIAAGEASSNAEDDEDTFD